jgi:hypothetical protein
MCNLLYLSICETIFGGVGWEQKLNEKIHFGISSLQERNACQEL